MSYVYTTADDDREQYDHRLPSKTLPNGQTVYYDEEYDLEFVSEFELPNIQLVTSDTRNAARAKVAKAVQSDPLYTTLSDYKPYVEKVREGYAKEAEASGRKFKSNKIQVPT